MNDDDISTVLWLTIEDDAGLWEAAWDLRSTHVGLTDEALEQLARVVVHRLHDDGLITVSSADDVFSDDLTPVPYEPARVIIDDPRWWKSPTKSGPVARLSATAAGEERYAALTAGRVE